MAQPAKELDYATLHDIRAKVMDNEFASIEKAVDYMESLIMADQEIFLTLARKLIRDFCDADIRSTRMHFRVTIAKTGSVSSQKASSRHIKPARASAVKLNLVRAADAMVERWLNTPMPGGRRLGDCTRSDLKEAADEKRNRMRTELRWTRFYDALASRMNSNHTVKDKFNDTSLQEIWDGVAEAKE